MQLLGAPPGGGTHQDALAVSDDGSVVVGYVWVGHNASFVWTAATGMHVLATQPLGQMAAIVSDVSGDGRIAVGFAAPLLMGGPEVAVQWNLAANTMTALPWPGATWTRAVGTNVDGTVVVGNGVVAPASTTQALHWSATSGLTVLGTLGGNESGARGVDAEGGVVVGLAQDAHGAVRAFRFDFGSIGAPFCAAVPNSTGAIGHITATGSRAVASNSVTLTAERLPQNAFGYFLASLTTGDVFPVAGSQGRLCLAGGIGRYVGPGQILGSGVSGSFQLQLDLTTTPTPTGSVSVAAGESWSFQAWHRDSAAGVATSNFTDATVVTFE
jgi:uncharacterized membrane protein